MSPKKAAIWGIVLPTPNHASPRFTNVQNDKCRVKKLSQPAGGETMALLCFLLLTPSLKGDRQPLAEPLAEPDQRIHPWVPITEQIKLKRGARVREERAGKWECAGEKVIRVRFGSGPNPAMKLISLYPQVGSVNLAYPPWFRHLATFPFKKYLLQDNLHPLSLSFFPFLSFSQILSLSFSEKGICTEVLLSNNESVNFFKIFIFQEESKVEFQRTLPEIPPYPPLPFWAGFAHKYLCFPLRISLGITVI